MYPIDPVPPVFFFFPTDRMATTILTKTRHKQQLAVIAPCHDFTSSFDPPERLDFSRGKEVRPLSDYLGNCNQKKNRLE